MELKIVGIRTPDSEVPTMLRVEFVLRTPDSEVSTMLRVEFVLRTPTHLENLNIQVFQVFQVRSPDRDGMGSGGGPPLSRCIYIYSFFQVFQDDSEVPTMLRYPKLEKRIQVFFQLFQVVSMELKIVEVPTMLRVRTPNSGLRTLGAELVRWSGGVG